MTVRKIKGQWYVDAYVKRPGRPPVRLRKRAPVQTKRDAEAYERSLLADVYGLSDKPRRTFEDFAVTDFARYIQANNRPSEEQSKESILRLHLVPAFGHKLLSEIEAKDIELYAAEKSRGGAGKKGLAAKTMNNHLTVLRKCLSLAHQYGEIEAIPALQWRRVTDQTFRFLDFEEAARLIRAADPGQWRAMVTVALRTGLRRGELVALRWTNVDLEARKLRVTEAVVRNKVGPPKNGKHRTVPLSSDAVDALRSIRGTVDLVFHHEGKHLTRGLVKWPLWRACRKAKLEPLQWHALRHTFASHLAMRGVPMRTIMDLLGHSSMAMTLRYAHLSPDALVDAVALLDGHPAGTAAVPNSGKANNDR